LKRELEEATKDEAAGRWEVRKYLIYYAQTDCRQLAELMHKKLPAELREFVYEYLCVEPDRPIPVGPYYHFRQYDRPFRSPPPDPDYAGRSLFAPFIRWASVDERRRHRNLNSYAGHVARAQSTEDIYMGKASDVGSTEVTHPRGLDGSDATMSSELVERFNQFRVGWDDLEDINLDENVITLADGRVKEEHDDKPPSDVVLPSSHLLNPRYVGPVISQEMQKMYHTRNTFSLCTVDQGIRNFLGRHSGYSMQKWHDNQAPKIPDDLKLEPLFYPSEHVRNLQIRVKLEQFHTNLPESATDEERYAYEQHFLRFTRKNLEGLNLLTKRQSKLGLDIEFVLMTALPSIEPEDNGLYAQWNFINFLQTIRNSVYRMMYDCVGATVKITHYDEGFSRFPRDITGLFALTKEQWEHVSTEPLDFAPRLLDMNHTSLRMILIVTQEKEVHEGRTEWVADFYMAPGYIDPETLTSGFSGREFDDLVRERWGIEEMTDTQARHPPKEGKY
jgi:hypothetical protein